MKSKESSQGNKKVKKMGKREKRKSLLDGIRPLVQKEGQKAMSEAMTSIVGLKRLARS